MLRRLRAVAALPLLNAVAACADDGALDGETGGSDLPEYEYDGPLGPETLFEHGVASGDPLPDGFIAWTRVSPAEDGSAAMPVEVFLEVAHDPDFTDRVAADYYASAPDRDHTVKIDVTGLEPGTIYYYRFFGLGRESRTGRVRTAPEGMVDRLKFAVASCSSLAHGWFHAYARIADRDDLDVVLHLGDYIYEYGDGEYGDVRNYDPPYETLVLDDYRRRYRQYRKDADLQDAHAAHAFVVVWDDHETADNAWSGGAENHDATEGDYADRRRDSTQAFFEWIPIREGEAGIIYRQLAYGDLVDIIMLDTRIIGRSEQGGAADIPDPDRSLLGDAQAAWLEDRLSNSAAQWKLLGQQVMMAQLKLVGATDAEGSGTFLNLDQWDGYGASRDRLWNFVLDQGIENFVVLTGDIHTSWANELTFDPNNPEVYDPATSAGALGVEFVCTAVTSPSIVSNSAIDFIQDANPQIRYIDLERKGYMVLDISPERIQCDWFYVADVTSPEGGAESWGKGWEVRSGMPKLIEAGSPAS